MYERKAVLLCLELGRGQALCPSQPLLSSVWGISTEPAIIRLWEPRKALTHRIHDSQHDPKSLSYCGHTHTKASNYILWGAVHQIPPNVSCLCALFCFHCSSSSRHLLVPISQADAHTFPISSHLSEMFPSHRELINLFVLCVLSPLCSATHPVSNNGSWNGLIACNVPGSFLTPFLF